MTTLTKIAEQTLTVNTNTVTFSSIPNTYTDLKLVISARSTTTAPSVYFLFNNDGAALYSNTTITGNGASTQTSFRLSGSTFNRFDSTGEGSSMTANVFGSVELYMPSYSSSTTFKSFIYDACVENNSASGVNYYNSTGAGLYRSNTAINRIDIVYDANMIPLSSFTLYGIKNT
jgi:hypothetical protein